MASGILNLLATPQAINVPGTALAGRQQRAALKGQQLQNQLVGRDISAQDRLTGAYDTGGPGLQKEVGRYAIGREGSGATMSKLLEGMDNKSTTNAFTSIYTAASMSKLSEKKHVIQKAYNEAPEGSNVKDMLGELTKLNTVEDIDKSAFNFIQFAKQNGILGSSAAAKDTRTPAIKEYEYGLENPGFIAAKKAKEDHEKTLKVSDKKFKNESDLRKEFLSQSKDYQKVRDAYTRVERSSDNPSAAGDLSLIFNYMKMLDPGSVVRESEFATAAATGGYGERLKAAGALILRGERLSEAMRTDFVTKSGVLMGGMQDQHLKREKSYRFIADRNGLDSDVVVVDILAPETSTTYEEGQTATGPGGKKVVFKNGKWEEM